MKRNRILACILIFAIASSMISCSSSTVKPKAGANPEDIKPADIKLQDVAFEQSITDLDKNLGIWGGKFLWSPNGSYAIFDTLPSSSNSSGNAEVVLADVKSNKLIKLAAGYLSSYIGWSKDGKYAAFNADDHIFLLNTVDKIDEKVIDKGYMPQFSPDGTKFIYMNDGLWVYDIASKSSKQLTKGKYDASPIWFSDSKRVFYFRDNGKNLGDGAGNEQVMSVLDTSTEGKFNDVNAGMKGKFRSARWLEQDHKILIFAGWDDGMSYNLLNLDDNKLTRDIVPQDIYMSFSFDDANKRMLIANGYTAAQAVAYDYDMKKLGIYDIYDDKENPGATDNLGVAALGNDRMIYLHTNLQEGKGALMISYLADVKQTKVTGYGNYSIPFISPKGELLAYFENGGTLKITPVDKLNETEIAKMESSKKAYVDLLRMLPDRVGTQWKYNGFAEYGHSMKIDGINVAEDGKTQYLISGKVDDMSDGEAKGDLSIYLEYLVSKDGIRETITKGEKMPHKIKEFDVLRYPLVKGNTWTQKVSINGQSVELKAEIIEESVNQDNNKVLKIQYTAKVSGMPNDTYKEVRTFEEGKGLIAFENTFDKDIDFNYSLFQFSK